MTPKVLPEEDNEIGPTTAPFTPPAKDGDATSRNSSISRAQPWKWLGTLQRTLSYNSEDEGGSFNSGSSELSVEDKQHLDYVMSNGTYAELERMKSILDQLTVHFEQLHLQVSGGQTEKESCPEASEKLMVELLLELRDIVHLVDFARAFVAFGGIEFILGCASEQLHVPRSVRSTSLFVLATLCEENPYVQYALLTRNSTRILAGLYFAEFPTQESDIDESDGLLRGRIVQVFLSSIVGHRASERLFCANKMGRKVIESGLGMHSETETLPTPPPTLRHRCLKLLRCLILSDDSTTERIALFEHSIGHVVSNMLIPETEPMRSIREDALKMLLRVLQKKKGKSTVLKFKDEIETTGRVRVWDIGSSQQNEHRVSGWEEEECTEDELKLWMKLAAELAHSI